MVGTAFDVVVRGTGTTELSAACHATGRAARRSSRLTLPPADIHRWLTPQAGDSNDSHDSGSSIASRGAKKPPCDASLERIESNRIESDRIESTRGLFDSLPALRCAGAVGNARHRVCERSLYRTGPHARAWTASPRARHVLCRQLEAYVGVRDRGQVG